MLYPEIHPDLEVCRIVFGRAADLRVSSIDFAETRRNRDLSHSKYDTPESSSKRNWIDRIRDSLESERDRSVAVRLSLRVAGSG